MNHTPNESEVWTAHHYYQALADACDKKAQGHPWLTPTLLTAIVSRETWWGWADGYTPPPGMPNGMGDYSQRRHDNRPMYHGFGFFQIDIDAHREFVESGAWADPYYSAVYAIEHGADPDTERHPLLIGSWQKLKTILPRLIPADLLIENKFNDFLLRATVAAYNCGYRNVAKAIKRGKSVDAYTAHHNYSRDVLELEKWWADEITQGWPHLSQCIAPEGG